MPQDKELNEKDYSEAVNRLKCDANIVKAFAEVESAGYGFLEDGKPKILFEAHKFSEFTNHIWDEEYPEISSRHWNRELYKGGPDEYIRLGIAQALDNEAALKSASWGKFQILGMNYKECGFGDIGTYVHDMYISEREHLLSFVNLLINWGVAKYLNLDDIEKVFKRYNGSSYKENKYPEKFFSALQIIRNS